MIAYLGEHGAELALGTTVVLVVGALAVRLSRAPLHRHRLAELTLTAAMSAAVLLAVPLPRPAAVWWSTPPAPSSVRAVPPVPVVVSWENVPLAPASTSRELRVPPPAAVAAPSNPVAHDVDGLFGGGIFVDGLFVARLFVAGAALMTLHLALALALLRRTLRRATPAPPWIASLAAEVAGPSAPRVLLSAREVRPFCCGLGRGTVVLPASLAQPALARRVEAVLRHEHAHLVQRHPRGRLMAALAAPLLYWHPLYWWLAREQRNSAEFLADDMAVGEFDKRRYVEELLELAETARRVRAPQVSRLGVLGSRQDFLVRMETLLMRRNRLATRSSAQHVTTRSLCACLLLAGMSVAWGMPPQDDTASPPPERAAASVSSFLAAVSGSAVAPRTDCVRAAFDIEGATALGQLMLRCADSGLEVGAFDVDTPEFKGHRACTLELSGASVEELADIVAGIEGVELLSVKVRRVTTSSTAAKPASDVDHQIARLSEQVDRLTQQYADMQTTHTHILNTILASTPKESGPGTIGKLLADDAKPKPVTSHVLAVQNSREPFYIDPSGEYSRLVTLACGEKQGVADDDVFEIYSGSTYKGRVRVVRVLQDSAWAIVLLEAKGQNLQAGDNATTDL